MQKFDQHDLVDSFIELVDIQSVTPGIYENMVDLSVEDDESFILANGIVSHNSAVSGIVEARNPDIHGGLPLRGKVMNVTGENVRTIMENEALVKIMGALGLVPGTRANRHALRYGKVFITTDADEDGKNIAALLVNFFYTLWPELFDPAQPAFINIFDTPLVIAVKGKVRKYFYNDNYASFKPEDFKGWEITRAKGLAALKRDDWRYVLENPKVNPITDDGELGEALSLLFDPKRADARKAWIGM